MTESAPGQSRLNVRLNAQMEARTMIATISVMSMLTVRRSAAFCVISAAYERVQTDLMLLARDLSLGHVGAARLEAVGHIVNMTL